MSIGVIVSERFCFWKCVRCCLQVCPAWETISCQTEKGDRVKHGRIQQGTCVEDGADGSHLLHVVHMTAPVPIECMVYINNLPTVQ